MDIQWLGCLSGEARTPFRRISHTRIHFISLQKANKFYAENLQATFSQKPRKKQLYSGIPKTMLLQNGFVLETAKDQTKLINQCHPSAKFDILSSCHGIVSMKSHYRFRRSHMDIWLDRQDMDTHLFRLSESQHPQTGRHSNYAPVSYTHLTLPTTLEV